MTAADQVITVVVLAVVALVGLAVLGPVVGVVSTTDTGSQVYYLEPAPDTATTVNNLQDDSRVRAGTGTALELQGQGAYVDDPTADSVFANGAWAVAVTADADESVVDTVDTRTVYAANNESVLLLYEQGNWTLRAANATGATAYAEANAARDQTHLGAQYNASAGQVELYVNGSLADTATFTAATEPRQPAAAWIGTVDEVRAWNASLNASQHATYGNEPVTPIATDTGALRLMFNAKQPLVAYYASGDAAVVGANAIVPGVTPPALQAGTDHAISDGQIRTLDGGAVDGAPVLIIGSSGVLGGAVAGLVSGVSAAVELLPIVMLAILSVVIISAIRRLQQGV